MKTNVSVPRFDPRALQEKLLAESRLNNGMITTIDAVDIPNGALTRALNARCRLDKTSRRPGKTDDAPAKPNSNKILGVVLFKKNDGSTHLIRITKSSIHKRGAVAWTNYTAGTNGSLTGGDFDYFSLAVVLNKLYFANGVDKIQEIDTAGSQYREAGPNSPKVKYITGFFNRIVGGYRVEGTEPDGPVSIVWSGDKLPDKWPNDVPADVSCGQSPLVESTSDLADFITGVFGGPSMLLVPREKSVWVGTKQPIASNPFNFANALPGIGSDCPNSIQVVPGGLAFLDTRTSQVWVWEVGSTPEDIGTAVYSDIMAGVDNPQHIFSGYNTVEMEFSLGVPIAGTTVIRVWTRNFRTKSWVYDEIDALSYIADVESPFATSLSFDELAGSFDSLVGSFDALGISSPTGKAARYYGYTNGDLFVEDANSETDVGVSYGTEVTSKDFKIPGVNHYVSKIDIEYSTKRVGQIMLSYSKDSGKTWRGVRTITTQLDRPRHITYVKAIKADRLRWKISSSNGAWDLLGYEIKIAPSGETKETD